MSSKNLRRIFRRPDRGYDEAEGNLTRLYRTILRDMGFTYEDQVQAINRWLVDPEGGNIQTHRELSEARGNYIRMITRPKMTVRTFYILLRMWYPDSITLTVKIGWRSALHGTTEHSVSTRCRPPTDRVNFVVGHEFKLSEFQDDEDSDDDAEDEGVL